jgi:hypothetical protein
MDSVPLFSASWKSNEQYAVALFAEAVGTALPPRIMSLSTTHRVWIGFWSTPEWNATKCANLIALAATVL